MLKPLLIIAEADPRKLVDANGNRIPLQDLPDELALAMAGCDIVEKRFGGDEAEVVETTHKPRPM